ncbi:MAG: VOC family protein [Spirochaetales bacterium]|nr:MAG: VOC family protein [Spirochaetales bacterium]
MKSTCGTRRSIWIDRLGPPGLPDAQDPCAQTGQTRPGSDSLTHLHHNHEEKHMIKGLHHIAMNVSDMTRSIKFYQDAFSFRLLRTWGEGKAAMLDIGDGSILELFERELPAEPNGPLLHIAVKTDDVDGAYAKALAAGGKENVAPKDIVIESEVPFPVRIAFVKGPDNEPVEMFCEK